MKKTIIFEKKNDAVNTVNFYPYFSLFRNYVYEIVSDILFCSRSFFSMIHLRKKTQDSFKQDSLFGFRKALDVRAWQIYSYGS